MPTVLVADDERDLLEMIAVELSSAGHHVRTTCDRMGELMLAHTAAPDATVLDVLVPWLSGITLRRVPRVVPDRGRAPIMLVTARPWVVGGLAADDRQRTVRPYSPHELASRVDALLYHHRTAGAARAARSAAAAAAGMTTVCRLAAR